MKEALKLVGLAMLAAWSFISALAELALLVGIGEDFLSGGAWSGVTGVVFVLLAVPLYCAVFALPCGLVGGLGLLALARFKRAAWSRRRWCAAGLAAGAVVGALPGWILDGGVPLLATCGCVTGAVVAGLLARRLEAWSPAAGSLALD